MQTRFKSRHRLLFGYFTNIWRWSEASVSVNPAHSWVNSKKNKISSMATELLNPWEAGWEWGRFLLNCILCYQLAVLYKRGRHPESLFLAEWGGWKCLGLGLSCQPVPCQRVPGGLEITPAAHCSISVVLLCSPLCRARKSVWISKSRREISSLYEGQSSPTGKVDF